MPTLKSLIHAAKNFREMLAFIRCMRNQSVFAPEHHLTSCADWLLSARRNSGSRGYATEYSALTDWGPGYVETTGYIIPTMLDLSKLLSRPELKIDAFEAAEWILERQLPNGAFPGLDGFNRAEAFDTGQVLLGLIRLIQETNDDRFRSSARRAVEWLLLIQREDGAFLTSGGLPKTYQSRVGGALYAYGIISGDNDSLEAGRKGLLWVKSQRGPNGSPGDCRLGDDDEGFLLHTIMYVIEGFLIAWQYGGEKSFLDAAFELAEPLKRICLEQDVILRSYYSSEWSPVSQERCLTGLAQWADVCFKLYDECGEFDYLNCGISSLFYVQSKQIPKGTQLQGGIPASVPVWGHYHPWASTNWTVKFFADAMISFTKYKIPAWKQQQIYVSNCIQAKTDSGAWARHSKNLDDLDLLVLKKLKAEILLHQRKRNLQNISILDLGCGDGRCVDWLASELPDDSVYGVDPMAPSGGETIRSGSVYELDFPSEKFDVVFSFIVFQHVSDLHRAFSEVRRVLNPGGVFIVVDRHRHSLRGLLMPWHEIKGRWMYNWDSPFRERWYIPDEWIGIFKQQGFEVTTQSTFLSPGDSGLRKLLMTNRFLLVSGCLRDSVNAQSSLEVKG